MPQPIHTPCSYCKSRAAKTVYIVLLDRFICLRCSGNKAVLQDIDARILRHKFNIDRAFKEKWREAIRECSNE